MSANRRGPRLMSEGPRGGGGRTQSRIIDQELNRNDVELAKQKEFLNDINAKEKSMDSAEITRNLRFQRILKEMDLLLKNILGD